MTPHTVWVGGNPFAELLKPRPTKAPKPAPKPKAARPKLPAGRPPEPRCGNCVYAGFKHGQNGSFTTDKPKPCAIEHKLVGPHLRGCKQWEYWKAKP